MERDKIGLEASVKLTCKENKILKKKHDNLDDSLQRKDVIIANLESHIEQIREQASLRQ